MYTVHTTAEFRRDLKRVEKRGYDISLLTAVIIKLAAGEKLGPKYKDHPLKGQQKGRRECHITPDWLLIYVIAEDKLILLLTETGTHSDLFG